MRVMITGATGFIGGAIARVLAGGEAQVHALARPGANQSRLAGCTITWHQGDITQAETIRGLFAQMDLVIHAAGQLGQSGLPDKVYQLVNVDGTRNVMNEIQALPEPPRVLYVSSPGVLGPTGLKPLDEDAPYRPSNAYERSKTAGEQLAREFASRGLPVIIIRPEFVYGPGDLHVLGMFQAIQKGRFFYINGGRSLCHPTYIDDAVRGSLRALRSGQPGQIYHITGPRAITFRELAESMAEAMGVPRPRFNVPRPLALLGAGGLELWSRITHRPAPLGRSGVLFFSNNHALSWQKAQEKLGYSPRCDLVGGLAATVAWYRQQGYL